MQKQSLLTRTQFNKKLWEKLSLTLLKCVPSGDRRHKEWMGFRDAAKIVLQWNLLQGNSMQFCFTALPLVSC